MSDAPVDVARRLLPTLRAAADSAAGPQSAWPEADWQRLVAAGVVGWQIPSKFGGTDLRIPEVLDGCRGLARGNLAITFILSQFQAACQRLVACRCPNVQQRWLPALAQGSAFATVGISHLTTSRQHVTQPAVRAEPTAQGFQLDGSIPWVTGADVADVVVLGGTLADGRQILAAVPRDRHGVTIDPPAVLLALTNSRTASVSLQQVTITDDDLLAGPVPNVLATLSGAAGGAGSLATSALALGHAEHAIDRLDAEAVARPALRAVFVALTTEVATIAADLDAAARGQALAGVTAETLRTRATSLALRAAQAYLAATKGAGYVHGHPAERLVREAMFFLVWSCPQAVATQLLQEFSRCEDSESA